MTEGGKGWTRKRRLLGSLLIAVALIAVVPATAADINDLRKKQKRY